jgi:isopentenyl-diphosphate delta-isomerase
VAPLSDIKANVLDVYEQETGKGPTHGAPHNRHQKPCTFDAPCVTVAHMTIMIPAWDNGELQPVEKLDAHKRGLKHKAVSIFVMNRGRVLIQQRAMNKYHTPGLWANTCCTHPEWDEEATDCAVRRLEEELGITGLYPSHRDQIEYRADVGGGLVEHEVVEVFLANAPNELRIKMNPSEVMNTRWVDFYDLSADVARHPNQYTPWLRIYLQDHTAVIFGNLLRTG